jgi:hypothetical protein
MKTKTCTVCKQPKPLSAFSPLHRGKDGCQPKCKECRNRQTRQYFADHKQDVLLQQRLYRARMGHRRRLFYGLTTLQFDAMTLKQGGKCAICQRGPTHKSLCVDHNHKTGKVRGLLCHRCNLALGAFDDDPAVLLRVISYLKDTELASNDKTNILP